MSNLHRPLLLILVTSLGGCATIEVRTAHDPKATFPKQGSYAWVPGPSDLPKDPRIDNAQLEARVRRAVADGLAERGYRLSNSERPVMLVGFHVVLDESLKPSIASRKYGYGPGLWGDSLGPDFERGSLILDILDPETKKLIWRGIAEADLDLTVSEDKKQKHAHQAVRQMLKQFPPKQ